MEKKSRLKKIRRETTPDTLIEIEKASFKKKCTILSFCQKNPIKFLMGALFIAVVFYDWDRINLIGSVESHFGIVTNSEQSTRVKYSSTQIIKLGTSPDTFYGTLNIDNVATLTANYIYDPNQIDMFLTDIPSRFIKNPKFDTEYPLDELGSIYFPKNGVENLKIKNLSTSVEPSNAQHFIFNRFIRKQTIMVGERKFLVSLLDIKDLSEPSVKLLEYTFAISEE
jgi:hypothetical protein